MQSRMLSISITRAATIEAEQANVDSLGPVLIVKA